MSGVNAAPAIAPTVAPEPLAGWRQVLPAAAAALTFAVLFWQPFTTLLKDWWSDPEAGHGLLLGPLAIYLAWKRGKDPKAAAQPVLGLVLLAGAVGLRVLSDLAAELFTMRFSMLAAGAALVLCWGGIRQIGRWWLPALLLLLSIPLPDVVLASAALPLQLTASKLGAAMLEARHVPVRLSGNVLHLPGQSLFVTEACSGLRSITALLSLGLLIAGLSLRYVGTRVFLVAAAIPVAVALNSVRIFLTGFLVYFVDRSWGEGVMHFTEGWIVFIAAFAILAVLAWVVAKLETRWVSWRTRPA